MMNVSNAPTGFPRRLAWLVLTCLFFLSALEAAPKDKDWPQYRGGPDRNNYRKVKDKIKVPKVLWMIDRSPVPAVVGEDVYTGGKALRLVDLKGGKARASWKGPGMTDTMIFGCTPVVLDDRVIVHSEEKGEVYAVSRDLGELLWTAEVPGARFNGACDGKAYVVCAGSKVVALETGDGSERWAFALSRLGGVELSPAIADGKALFGAKDNKFYAIDMNSGEEVWSYEGERAFAWTDPVVAFGKVYVGDRGGVINAIDLKKGTLLWSRKSGATGLSAPGITPKNILVGFSKFVGTFNAKTGEPDPKYRGFKTNFNSFGSPTLVGNTLYFGNLDGHLYAYDYKTEQFKWAFEVGEKQQVLNFVYHEDILLVSTTEGLYALGNDSKKKKLPKQFVLIAEEVEEDR